LKEHEAGRSAGDLCRKHGISDQTLYNWKAKYGGLKPSEASRLKGLEDENRRLKNVKVGTSSDRVDLAWRVWPLAASGSARSRLSGELGHAASPICCFSQAM